MILSTVHNEVFDYLYGKHKENAAFKFTTRTRNNRERLKKGYWFIGGEDYLELSFWQGKDSLAKINNIGFTVLLRKYRKEVYYNFSCKDGNNCDIIEKLANELNVQKVGNPNNNYWEKTIVSSLFSINQVIDALELFINNEKKLIDKLVSKNISEGLSFIDDYTFEKNINKIESYKNLNGH